MIVKLKRPEIMDFGVIHVHMVFEAMGKNEVDKGEKHRNKGKEK